MNEFFKWHPINELPEMVNNDCCCNESEPVLGLYKGGSQAVVTCQQYYYDWEDEPEPISWRTNCSEGWIVTDELIAWCYLPPTAEFLKQNENNSRFNDR